MTDITTTGTAVVEGVPTQPAPAPTFDDLHRAIFVAIREELDLHDLTDEEIWADLRAVDKVTIPRSDNPAEALFTFEVGKPYPGIERSQVVALFLEPVEDSAMPGEVRIYMTPGLPLAGAHDHLCYTLNRVTLGMARETMTRAKFAKEIGAEWADQLVGPDDEEEEPDDEEEGLSCFVDACMADPVSICECMTCNAMPIEERVFAVCADGHHIEEVAQEHLKTTKRAPKWAKISTEEPS
jgi:hypothetical protein